MTGIQHRDANNVLVAGYGYTYDNGGNRNRMVESNATGVVADYVYTYDAANRLKTESIGGTATAIRSYTYDRAGNRLTSRYLNAETRYQYNSSDELTRIVTPQGMFQNYSYDTAGNLISQTGILGNSSYAYNSRNLMVSVSGVGLSASYQYDHAGRRIADTTTTASSGAVSTKYLWDEFSQYGDVVLETRNVAASPYTAYTLANGMLISQRDTYGSLYFLSDAQNSTKALTNELGTVTSSYSYDAFGNLASNIAPETVETHYLYTGQQFDPATELYSLRARYYDPSIGRFMSRDTWAYDYQNPVELNRYVYAAGNPTRYTDPSGHRLDEVGDISNFIHMPSLTPTQWFGLGVVGLAGIVVAAILWSIIQTPDKTQTDLQTAFQLMNKLIADQLFQQPNGPSNFNKGLRILAALLLGFTAFANITKEVIEGEQNVPDVRPYVMIVGPGANFNEVLAIYNARRATGSRTIAVEPTLSDFESLVTSVNFSEPLTRITDRHYENSDGSLVLVRRNATAPIPEITGAVREMISIFPTEAVMMDGSNNFVLQAMTLHLSSYGAFYMVTESKEVADGFHAHACNNALNNCPQNPNQISQGNLESGQNHLGISIIASAFPQNYEIWGNKR